MPGIYGSSELNVLHFILLEPEFIGVPRFFKKIGASLYGYKIYASVY